MSDKELRDMIKNSVPEGNYDLFVDIGLSYNAPHSYDELKNNPNAFVVGIGRHPDNCKSIRNPDFVKYHPNHGGGYISEEENRFLLLPFGIGNSDTLEKRKFYLSSGDPGTSSFLVSKRLNEVKGEIDIEVISLKFILDNLPWEKFNSKYFKLKSDTQGYEVEVIKSMGDYINNVSELVIENTADEQYVGAPSAFDIHTLLESNGMICESMSDGNSYFIRRNINED